MFCGLGVIRYAEGMSLAELRSLPATEKLKIIETLWNDLANEAESVESPAWHEKALQETEGDFAAGRLEKIDWEDAKRELRSRFK
jgi:hypothetical protein